jgi:hypothetical protein
MFGLGEGEAMSLRQEFERHVETYDVKRVFDVQSPSQFLKVLTANINALFDNYRASVEVEDGSWVESCWTTGHNFFDLNIPGDIKTTVDCDQCLPGLLPGQNQNDDIKKHFFSGRGGNFWSIGRGGAGINPVFRSPNLWMTFRVSLVSFQISHLFLQM